jgi:hypothetical protein
MTVTKKPLLALTLWRPWPLLIAAGVKKVENRPWHPRPRLQPGEWFAVHSGKKWDGERCIPMAQQLGVPISFFDRKDVESTISCVARYDGHSDDHEEIVRQLGPDHARWHFEGQIGWMIGDVQAIEPVPCARGMQGLWSVPDDVAAQVREAFRRARAAR